MLRRLLLPSTLAWLACSAPRPIYVEAPATAEVVVTPGTATLTWRKGLNAEQTLVVRTLGSVEATKPPAQPVLGSDLGGGTVLALSDGERFVDAALPDTCGPFAWHLWSRAADGTWSAAASTVRSLRGAHTLAPTAQVTNLASVFEGASLRLTWTPPDANTGFEQVVVVRKVGVAPQTQTDGVLVYSGPSSQATDLVSNLSASQATWYAVFNCNGCGKCAGGAPAVSVVSPAGSDGGTDLTISGLTAAIGGDRRAVALAWVSNAPRVRVLRTLNGAASGPMDPGAAVVFDGAGSVASDAVDGLLPSTALEARVYTYTAWGCAAAGCSASPASAVFTLTLTQALQAGGYTLAWRHATASTCNDATSLGVAASATVPNWWKSCDDVCSTATARQLTAPSSDDEIAAVRSYFSSKAISVSRVLSSEYCRCVRTAEGFQLGPTVEQRQALTFFVYAEATRCADTYALLNQAPDAGTNAALVGHAGFTAACAVLDGLAWGEAAIFKPVAGGQPRYVDRVLASGWAALP